MRRIVIGNGYINGDLRLQFLSWIEELIVF